jgi:PDZ domain-containing protein
MSKRQPVIKKRWVVFFAVLLFLHFYQLPYYYSQPGQATHLDSIISVEDGYKTEAGSFMLTTISMGRANAFLYVWAQLSDYRNLYPEERLRFEDETDEEYQHRQLALMTDSQEIAKIVAYEKAGNPITYEYHGVLVSSFVKGMPAEAALKPGDHIIAVDGVRVETAETFMKALEEKIIEDKVSLLVKRDGKQLDVSLGFDHFPESLQAPADKVGIGILAPVTDREVTFEPEVTVDTSEIGGPSAGLMFTLEIYNQLIKEDVTKGYEIAGTGTMNEQGEVGPIGGANQKVVAADKAGAEYFFAPNENGEPTSNYQEALAAAKDIDTKMKVIPVDTVDDAINFLHSLPEKGE